jgi:predicted nucleotidyltransferase component of viral defense system
MDMDFATIRRTTIIALFADDELAGMLALKGGNALSLVHGITSRTSVDLDFSISQDFPDFPRAKERIFHVLEDRFDSAGYIVLDAKLVPKPRIDGEDAKPWWGGYELSFKLISKERYERLRNRPNKLSIEAMETGPHNRRVFTVDLSKYEYTQGREEHDLDDYTIYVYTPEMIVIEKLRAICQQMPEYPHMGRASARARDFFDIYETITRRAIDLTSPENIEKLHHIFAAKDVPLSLLAKVRDSREFHRPDWASVQDSVTGEKVESFDFYFDFVLGEIERLKALGKI